MRDLSQSSVGFNRRSLRYSRFTKIAMGFLLILAIGSFLANQVKIGGGSGQSVVLSDASRGLVPVPVDERLITTSGVDLTTQIANLADVKYGGSAKATATRSFGGGSYILNVEATLPDPKNTYYEVWLVSANEVVPVDFMNGSKTSWSLSLRDKDKFSRYKSIWITLERTKDNIPEEHVMEGTF